MIVPFATCRAGACREALQGLRLPHLQKLLRWLAVESTDPGDAASLSLPHERAIARAWGLEPTDGLIPFAALQVAKAGGQADGDGWAWITPTHWRVGRDHVDMVHPLQLQLDAEDSHALLAAVQPYFAEDGIELSYDAPLCWLARSALFRTLPTASLDRVVGHDLQAWMPAGAAGRPLRRLQQEMQMLLYTMPLNDARQRGGLLPVNSFWVSATGALPAGPMPHPVAGLHVSPYLHDAALLGDWRTWSSAWHQLDDGEGARLLADAEQGRPVRVTLCGEAGSRTWSSSRVGFLRRLTSLFGSPPFATLLEGL